MLYTITEGSVSSSLQEHYLFQHVQLSNSNILFAYQTPKYLSTWSHQQTDPSLDQWIPAIYMTMRTQIQYLINRSSQIPHVSEAHMPKIGTDVLLNLEFLLKKLISAAPSLSRLSFLNM